MAKKKDDFENPTSRQAPKKSLVDKLIDGAIKAGSGMVSVMSGLLAAALIVYSGYVLYDTYETERKASSSAWDLLQYRPELIDDQSVPLSSPELQAINEDYRAWLTVYDSAIDYPVMQGKDDLYYASHDIYKHSSLTGAIYMAWNNARDFSDSYNLIYGHHMDNGAMFGGLDKFADEGYFNSHRTAILITPKGAFDIEFFAFASTNAYEKQIYTVGNRAGEILSFLNAPTGETRVFPYDPTVAAGAEKVIALSTCASEPGKLTDARSVLFGTMKEHIYYQQRSVKKVWDDNDDQDGKRPAELTVKLMRAGEMVKAFTLNAENDWTAQTDPLPMNKNGVSIWEDYTWVEEDVQGYTLTGSVTDPETWRTTLTNKIDGFETVTLTMEKQWQDDEDRDGLRPERLRVILTADGKPVYDTYLPDRDGSWTASFSDQPKYSGGKEITYLWDEEAVPVGYLRSYGESADTYHTVIVNTHAAARVKQTVRKVWNDADNQDGMRPSTLRVTLLANGEAVRIDADYTQVNNPLTLEEANAWSGEIGNLPVYRDHGVKIEYTWQEENVPDYTLQTPVVRERGDQAETTLTNAYDPQLIDVSVRKLWADYANRNGMRPESLTLSLMNGEELVGQVTLRPKNSWTGVIRDLPRYSHGQEIPYRWTEPEVPGYRLRSVAPSETVEWQTEITNELIETTDATVVKAWDDLNDRAGQRPNSVQMTLYGNGEIVTADADGNPIRNPVTLTKDGGWTATVTGLAKFARKATIVYTWVETPVEGYMRTGSASQGNVTTVTNRKALSLSVRKVWQDAGNANRPQSLQMVLLGGRENRVVTLTAANGWTASVTVPQYTDDGREISYRWIEPQINGYRQTKVETNGNVTAFTNTRIVTPPPVAQEYTLTIYYIYENGTTAAETHTETHQAGDAYSVPSPAIPGYAPSIPNVNGVMPKRDAVITVIYTRPDTTVTITEMDTPLGLGRVYMNVGDCIE